MMHSLQSQQHSILWKLNKQVRRSTVDSLILIMRSCYKLNRSWRMLMIRSNNVGNDRKHRKRLRLSWKVRRRTQAIFFMLIQKAILSNWSKLDLGPILLPMAMPIAEAERQADRGHLVGRMAEAKALSSRRLWTQGTWKRISWITMTNRRCSKSQKFKSRMANLCTNYRLAISKICLNRDCKARWHSKQ